MGDPHSAALPDGQETFATLEALAIPDMLNARKLGNNHQQQRWFLAINPEWTHSRSSCNRTEDIFALGRIDRDPDKP